MKWFWQNKEWFFQGLGALLVMAILGFLARRFWKSQKERLSQSSHSQAISARGHFNLRQSTWAVQAAGDSGTNVNIGEFHQGLGVAEVREIAVLLWEANFPRPKEEAIKEARGRVESFLSELTPRLSQSLTSTELDAFRKPEVQYSFNQALQGAALRQEPELRRTLADLIIKRVRASGENLDGIIYSEAIKTVPMLTRSMLNILALKVFMTHGDFRAVNNWTDLASVIKAGVIPFLGFSGQYLDFQHLAYSGCGDIAAMRFGTSGFVSDVRQKCANLFQRDVTAEELGSLPLSGEVTQALFELAPSGGFRFRTRSNTTLKAVLERLNLAREMKARISTLFEETLEREENSRALLLKHIPESEQPIQKWSKSLIAMLDLSSVGMVIGGSHFESKTGIKLTLDLEQQAKDIHVADESLITITGRGD